MKKDKIDVYEKTTKEWLNETFKDNNKLRYQFLEYLKGGTKSGGLWYEVMFYRNSNCYFVHDLIKFLNNQYNKFIVNNKGVIDND